MKDLYKPGRDLDEYLKEDGTLKVNCLTCINRDKFDKPWGGYLCSGGMEFWNECADMKTNIHKYWEPRVDVNAFITEEDMSL